MNIGKCILALSAAIMINGCGDDRGDVVSAALIVASLKTPTSMLSDVSTTALDFADVPKSSTHFSMPN